MKRVSTRCDKLICGVFLALRQEYAAYSDALEWFHAKTSSGHIDASAPATRTGLCVLCRCCEPPTHYAAEPQLSDSDRAADRHGRGNADRLSPAPLWGVVALAHADRAVAAAERV